MKPKTKKMLKEFAFEAGKEATTVVLLLLAEAIAGKGRK